MRFIFVIKFLVLYFYLCFNVSALVIGSDEQEIYIDANFTGKDLLVFGAFYSDPTQPRDEKRDLLIEVVGPSEDVILRKKDSFFGFWLNRHSVEFRDVPGFYYLSSTRELDDEFLDKNKIGLLKSDRAQDLDWSSLTINWGNIESAKDKNDFYKALIRTKDREKLYKRLNDQIEILDGNLFRTNIEIPNTVPVGVYKVNVFMISNDNISQTYSYNFTVTRVGIEEAIFNFSKDFPLLYGLISLIIAIIIGWSGAEIFKRFRRT